MAKLFIETEKGKRRQKAQHKAEPDQPAYKSRIHVVFQQADVAVLKSAMEMDGSLQGDIFQIKDEFAVGPLANIDTEEGWQARLAWWQELIKNSPYPDTLVGSFDDQETVAQIRQRLDEESNAELWLWMGQNQHDVCGYYWLINQLKAYQGRVMILYLNNLPFINERGQLFYPTTLHQIPPREYVKAKKLCRKVTPGEFEVDADEWSRLCIENAVVRILEGGKKIAGKGEDFYDADILAGLGNEWQRGAKAMYNILTKMKIKTGDVFLLWRMFHLVATDKLEINGDPAKGWKEFEVRLKTAASEPITTAN